MLFGHFCQNRSGDCQKGVIEIDPDHRCPTWEALVMCSRTIFQAVLYLSLQNPFLYYMSLKYTMKDYFCVSISCAGFYTTIRKTTRLKSGWSFGQTDSPLSTARVLIDAVGLCLLRVSEVWRLFAPDLRIWINSFSGSDFKPRLVYKTWYFCYFFTNFDQQF